MQQAQQQQEKIQQQQFAEHLHKQDEVKKHQVNTAKHADEVEIHGKDKHSGEGSGHKKQHSHTGDDEKNTEKDGATESEHIIDIKI